MLDASSGIFQWLLIKVRLVNKANVYFRFATIHNGFFRTSAWFNIAFQPALHRLCIVRVYPHDMAHSSAVLLAR